MLHYSLSCLLDFKYLSQYEDLYCDIERNKLFLNFSQFLKIKILLFFIFLNFIQQNYSAEGENLRYSIAVSDFQLYFI